jgi:hypothetical protein
MFKRSRSVLMKRVSDPEWQSLQKKAISWDERVRLRELELQTLQERLREVEQQLGALKRRLAVGTGPVPLVRLP